MKGQKRWDYQFFPTPKALAYDLVRKARIKKEDIILEPSAGRGAILEYACRFPHRELHCCELMEENIQVLRKKGFSIRSRDFLSLQDYGLYTKIIANPPFTQGQDQKHIRKMYEILSFGGRVVSLCSGHFLDSYRKADQEFWMWLKSHQAIVQELPPGLFEHLGVSVRIALIILDK